MTLSCDLCSSPIVKNIEVRIEHVHFNGATGELEEKITPLARYILCEACTRCFSNEPHLGDSDIVQLHLADRRELLIFRDAICNFPENALFDILANCVSNFDRETIVQMQMKDDRVSGVLREVFYLFLGEQQEREIKFIVSVLSDVELKLGCAIEFAGFLETYDRLDETYQILADAFRGIHSIVDQCAKIRILAKMGYIAAYLTLNLKSFSDSWDLRRNELLLNTIIFELDENILSLGENLSYEVFFDKENLKLFTRIYQELLVSDYKKAKSLAALLSAEVLRDFMLKRIETFEMYHMS